MRLTKEDRKKIAATMLKDTLQGEYDSLCKHRQAFAMSVYERAIPEIVKKSEDGLFGTRLWFEAKSLAQSSTMNFNGAFALYTEAARIYKYGRAELSLFKRPKEISKKVPYRLYNNWLEELTDKKEIEELETIREECYTFNVKVIEAKTAIEVILNSVSNTDKLIEKWPECQPYIPNPPVKYLPMVPVSKANAILGLPKVEA